MQKRARIHPCARIRVYVYSVANSVSVLCSSAACLNKTFVRVCICADVSDAHSTSTHFESTYCRQHHSEVQSSGSYLAFARYKKKHTHSPARVLCSTSKRPPPRRTGTAERRLRGIGLWLAAFPSRANLTIRFSSVHWFQKS